MTTVAKKHRTVKIVGRVLTIREDGKATSFHVSELASLEPGRLFRLEKFASDRRGDGDDSYNVLLNGEHGECGCRGHVHHARRGVVCRHRAALQALLARGRLDQLDTVTCVWCRGYGRQANGYGAKCKHCHGTGRQQEL